MTKRIIKYLAAIVAIIAIIVIVVIIYYSTTKHDNSSINDKLEQEIKYLDTELVSVINTLNNLDTECLITNNAIKPNGSSESNSSSNSSTRTRRATKSS